MPQGSLETGSGSVWLVCEYMSMTDVLTAAAHFCYACYDSGTELGTRRSRTQKVFYKGLNHSLLSRLFRSPW